MTGRLISEAELHQFKRTATLRQIEAMSVLGELLSITETARALGVTPASVSLMLKRFEKHFSFDLFVKKRIGIVLTEEGKQLLDNLEPLRNHIDETFLVLASMRADRKPKDLSKPRRRGAKECGP